MSSFVRLEIRGVRKKSITIKKQRKIFGFSNVSGANRHVLDKDKELIDFHCLLLNDKVVNTIDTETSWYDQQKKVR